MVRTGAEYFSKILSANERSMKIAVVGLGHVGSVTVAALLRAGHVVVGIDKNAAIRDCLAAGLTPFREPGIAELIAAGRDNGRLSIAATPDENADIVFVSVGTPGRVDGSLDLTDVAAAAGALGDAVRRRSVADAPMLLVFQSTMLPGSMRTTVLPAIAAAAGEPCGRRYEVVHNPVFMREGSALADFVAPARIVIGERAPGCAKPLVELFAGLGARMFTTSFEAAELAKCSDNGLHALKIAFANEIGRLAVASGVAPADIFEMTIADTELNLSAAYLRPGGAFGGPCLPKDVRALAAHMDEAGVAAPVIAHILDSNSAHFDFLTAEIERRAAAKARVLLVGLSFKPDTDDVSESPYLALAAWLLERGYDLTIHDPDIALDSPAGPVRTVAGLPDRIRSAVASQIPASGRWDLVIMGKSVPELARLLDGRANIFHIHRLLA